MKRHLIIIAVLFIAGAFLAACGGRNKRQSAHLTGQDTLYMPSYAVGFAVLSGGERSTVLAISNPWQGSREVTRQMFISRDGETAPEGFEGTVISAPLKDVVCMSSSYVAFLDQIGEIDAVKGVSGARYITNDTIRARFSRGSVRDVGFDSHMNYELLSSLRPDLVMIYGVSGENIQFTNKMDELGINYFYVGDYVERSALGKAEWLVALGEMFDKRAQAEEIFEGISESYNQTKALVEESLNFHAEISSSDGVKKPVVMLNAPYRDTWFVPGDRSYMARLISDAGGDYACAGVDSEESRPVSGESAYIFASKSDLWLNPGQASTLAEVKSMNPKFADIPSVGTGRVYNGILRSTPDGGSDFWESGAVRADIVLKDMVKMIHPEILPDHELYYFKRLE